MKPGVNDDFFRIFSQTAPDGARIYDSRRNITEDGQNRVLRALLYLSCGQGGRGPSVVDKLIALSAQLGVQRQRRAAECCAAAVVSLVSNPAYDIGADMSRAMADFIDFVEKREAGKVGTFGDYLGEVDMFDPRSTIAEEILKLLASDKSAPAIAEYVNAYCDVASKSESENSLIKSLNRTREEIWKAAARTVDEKAAERRHAISAAEGRFSVTHADHMRDNAEYRAVYSRFHRPDGSALPNWLKAPNGKPTNLDPVQFVLVRTPAFKVWFGDWEKKATADAILGDESISSDGALLRMPGAEQRKAAKALYEEIKAKGSVRTLDGRDVKFTNTGFKEIKHHSADPRTLAIVPILREVISSAHFIGDGKDEVVNGNRMKYHLYARKVNLGDGEMVARVVLREDVNGNIFYDEESTSVENIREIVDSVAREPNTGRKPQSPYAANSIAQFFHESQIAAKNASKVVDENGEPLVVYHGTQSDFTVFKAGKHFRKQGTIFFAPPSRKESVSGQFARDTGRVNHCFLNIRRLCECKPEERDQVSPKEYDGFLTHWVGNKYESPFYNYSTDTIDTEVLKEGDPIEYGVFSPSNIKSATDNTGAFDATDPDIRHCIASKIRPATQAEYDRIIRECGELTDPDADLGQWVFPDGRVPMPKMQTVAGGLFRSVSHDSIFRLLDRPERANPSEAIDYGYADTLCGGAIRLNLGNGGVEFAARPTDVQVVTLVDYVYEGYRLMEGEDIDTLDVDLHDFAHDRHIAARYRRGTSPFEIVRDVRGFYDAGVVPQGNATRYSIASPGAAANADERYLTATAEAMRMEKSGKSREAIFDATGLWRGADGEWRVELPDVTLETVAAMRRLMDSPATQKHEFKDGSVAKVAQLGGLARHDVELGNILKAYPGARNVWLVMFPGEVTKDGYTAVTNLCAFDGQAPGKLAGQAVEIHIAMGRDDKAVRNSIVHELQHVIQGEEGWENGTTWQRAGSYEEYHRSPGEMEAEVATVRSLEEEPGYVFGKSFYPWETEDAISAWHDKVFANDTEGAASAYSKRNVDGVRFSIAPVYTGSAADYDKPSLVYIGTGEGSQVYGWGLYGSGVREVAEGYANVLNLIKGTAGGVYIDGMPVDESRLSKPLATVVDYFKEHKGTKDEFRDTILKWIEADPQSKLYSDMLTEWDKVKDRIEKTEGTHENLYEQTFFTNREPGDESHLLSWFDGLTAENARRIVDEARKEAREGKLSNVALDEIEFSTFKGHKNYKVYDSISYAFELENGDVEIAKRLASEFLARADIDGIKYPVDSFGGKGVKDGDAAGWNYVSFRDDNIRIDHKWVDGKKRFSIRVLNDGRRYVDVADVPPEFRNVRNINDKKRIVGAYIRKRWKGKVIDEDGVRAFVNGATAHEYTNPAKRTTEQVFGDKLDAATELEAIVATSTNPTIVPDGQNGHVHKGVKHWEHRDTMFAVDGRFYAGKVNIKVIDKTNDKGENQRLMHDVTDIKDITDEVGTLIDDASKEASNIGDVFHSIPNSPARAQPPAPTPADPEANSRRAIRSYAAESSAAAEHALENYVAYFKLAHLGEPREKTIARIGLSLGMASVDAKRVIRNAQRLAETARGTLVEKAARNGNVATAMALLQRNQQVNEAVSDLIAGGVSLGGKLAQSGAGQVNKLLQRRVDRMMASMNAATLADMEGEMGLDLAAEILANNPDAFDADFVRATTTADQSASADEQSATAAPADGGERELSDSEKYRRAQLLREANEKVARLIEEAKRRAQDNKQKAEQRRAKIAADAAGTGAGGGPSAAGADPGASETAAPDTPGATPTRADFRTPGEFAAFLRVYCQHKFAETHNLATLGDAEADRLFAEFYRICARQELRDLADKLLAPEMLNESGELVTNQRVAKLGAGVRVHVNRRLAELEKGLRPDTIERISADIFAFINKAAIRVSRVDLIAEFKKDLKARFLKDPKYDEFKFPSLRHPF